MIVEYEANGGGFDQDDADIIGAEFEKLREHGYVTAPRVLAASKDMTSDLHYFFEWDNEIASDKWRLQQARRMVEHITIRIVKNVPIASEKIIVKSKDQQKKPNVVAKPVEFVDHYQETVNKAIRSAQKWRNKYRDIEELEAIFSAIDEWEFK